MTIADMIRSMNDAKLADFLYSINDGDYYCQYKKECEELLDSDEGIPEEWCKVCLMECLQRVADPDTLARLLKEE